MMYIDLPNINPNGTAEQQLAEIRSYIYRNNEQINAALSNLGPEKVFEAATTALSSAADSENELPEHLNRYRKLRDLIIKTADSIVKTEETWSMALNGSYLAKSQFGEYLLNTSVTVDGNSTGFTELYGYSTALGSDYGIYKHNMQNYIKHGLLDDSGATPVYGIEVGLLEDEFTIIDEETGAETTITPTYRYRTRITPDKWSFLRDSSSSSAEVAYITEDMICFPKAEINGGSINIGNNFQVTNDGILTAAGGVFNWNNNNNRMNISGSGFNFYEKISGNNQKIFSLSPQAITFYRPDSQLYDQPMVHLKRGKRHDGAEVGLEIDLRGRMCDYFSILRTDSVVTRYITIIPEGSQSDIESTSGIFLHQPTEFKRLALFDSGATFSGAVTFNNSLTLSNQVTINGGAAINATSGNSINITSPPRAEGFVTTPYIKSDGEQVYKDHTFYVKLAAVGDDDGIAIHVRNGLVTLN